MENSRSRQQHQVLGSHLVGKMRIVPEAVIDKVQAYPTPKNVKEVQVFVGMWRVQGTLIPHLEQHLPPLHHMLKKGHV